MKVGNYTINFNYKSAGYKDIKEVPYWRLYLVRVTKELVEVPLPQRRYYANLVDGQYVVRYRTEIIDKSIGNYPLGDLEFCARVICRHQALDKGERLVAYARKGQKNRAISIEKS